MRTPDFVVIGNGRAVIIEVDGPHHFGATRKADDHTRDRHWDRCGVRTIRIPSEHANDPVTLKDLLREDLRRRLWMPLTRVNLSRSACVMRCLRVCLH